MLLFIIVGVVGCRQSDPATPTSTVPIVQPNVILELPIVTITVSTVTPAADRVTGAAEVHDPIATPEPAATNLLAGIYDEPTPTTPDLTSDDFQEGMNYASWWQGDYQQPWTDESMQSLADTGSNWVSIIVTCYQETYVDTTITCDLPRTPTDSDLIHAIRQAHALDLNVMLKPHLDLNNDPVHWRGDIGTGFTNEAEWLAWFAGYQTFFGRYAALAEAEGVRQFSVGTELVGTSGKETAWREVVTEVREQFSGSLVYAGNHDREATATTWWDALDYIGVDAYYPLASDNEPTKEELQAAWVTPLAI